MASAYRKDIDGLRAVAVLAVIFFHAWPHGVTSGFVGVDVFFVISGFLIGGIIFRDVRARKFSFTHFYARRARRILPALFGVVIVFCLFGCFVLDTAEMKELATSSGTALLGISNIKFFLRNEYFDSSSTLLPMLMTWSLGVEEQFYLLFPLLMYGIARWQPAKVAKCLLVIGVLSFICCLWMTLHTPQAAFFLLPARIWELGAGAWLAVRMATAPKQAPRLQQWSGMLGLAMVAASIFLFDAQTNFPGYAALLPVLGTMMLLYAKDSYINRSILSAEGLVFIGKISYSCYLWHWPLMAFARKIAIGEPSDHVMAIIVILSLVAGYISWRFIEQPFRTNNVSDRRTVRYYALALVAMLAFTAELKFMDGWPTRVPAAAKSIEDTIALGRGNCLVLFDVSTLDPSEACNPTQGPAHAVALVGDSHASALGPGLQEVARDHHVRLIQLTKSSCMPFLDISPYETAHPERTEKCTAFMHAALDRITQDDSITTVVVAAAWSKGPEAMYETSTGKRMREKEAIDYGLPPLLDKIRRSGKRVIVVEDVPSFAFSPNRQATGSVFPLRHWIMQRISPFPEMIAGKVDRRSPMLIAGSPEVTARIRTIAQTTAGVHYLEVRRQLCDADTCRFMQDDTLLYVDGSHLSVVGSTSIDWSGAGIK